MVGFVFLIYAMVAQLNLSRTVFFLEAPQRCLLLVRVQFMILPFEKIVISNYSCPLLKKGAGAKLAGFALVQLPHAST